MQRGVTIGFARAFALGLVAVVAAAFAGTCAALLFTSFNQWWLSADFALRGMSNAETVILAQLAMALVTVTAIFILPLTVLLRWRRWESGVAYPVAGLVVGGITSAALLRDADATATFAIAAAASTATWWWLFRRSRVILSGSKTPAMAAALAVVLLGAITVVPLWRGYSDDVAAQDEVGSLTSNDMIVGGVGDRNTLWLFDVRGQLVAYDRSSWKERVVVPAGVVALQRHGEDVWALVTEPGTTSRRGLGGTAGRADLIRILPGNGPKYPSFTYEAGDNPLTLTFADDRPVVLTAKTVRSLDGEGKWSARKLSRQPVGPPGDVTVAGVGGHLFVGRNAGEWGGGVARVDISTGIVSGIERRDSSDLCAGPLNANCDPVSGLVSDPNRPGCVLASTGLVHISLMSGRVLRICGNVVEVVLQRRVEMPAQIVRRGVMGPPRSEATEPIGSLVSDFRGTIWAASPFALYRIDGSDVARTTMPHLQRHGRLYLAELNGLVIISSLKNARHSLGGATPIIVPTAR